MQYASAPVTYAAALACVTYASAPVQCASAPDASLVEAVDAAELPRPPEALPESLAALCGDHGGCPALGTANESSLQMRIKVLQHVGMAVEAVGLEGNELSVAKQYLSLGKLEFIRFPYGNSMML